MSRRALLRTVLAAVGAPLALATAATAAPTAGSTTARTWTWTTLPGAGVQVYATDARNPNASVTVSWTADGTVTATWTTALTVTAPARGGEQHVTSGAGYGLAVRRAGA